MGGEVSNLAPAAYLPPMLMLVRQCRFRPYQLILLELYSTLPMDGDGKGLGQEVVDDEPSAHGQTVLFYFTTRSATYIIQGCAGRVAKTFRYSS